MLVIYSTFIQTNSFCETYLYLMAQKCLVQNLFLAIAYYNIPPPTWYIFKVLYEKSDTFISLGL